MSRFYSLTFVTLSLLLTCGFISADEKLKGIACRSVHLGFPSAEGTAFYNEMKIVSSAPGTYFMVCGWNKGYFGIQEQASGKKLLIFSVWDSEQNDPKAVKEDNRTKLIHKDEKTRIGRFGGEGTGGQSFYDFDWKIDHTYALHGHFQSRWQTLHLLWVLLSPRIKLLDSYGFFLYPY